jgi:predicted DCC family thiol-disulfide oxidoreductase YuxK
MTTTSGKAIILYDGQCPLCQKSVAILKRLDWLDRLTYHDARQSDTLPESEIPLDPQKLLEEMHLLTSDRKQVYVGFFAFRWIAARIPVLMGLFPLLFLPGVPALGTRVYRWVAKNRFGLVPCHDGQCQVPRPPASLMAPPSSKTSVGV